MGEVINLPRGGANRSIFEQHLDALASSKCLEMGRDLPPSWRHEKAYDLRDINDEIIGGLFTCHPVGEGREPLFPMVWVSARFDLRDWATEDQIEQEQRAYWEDDFDFEDDRDA